MRASILLLAFSSLMVTAGCVSVSTVTLTGKELRYPVSLSQSILDSSGNSYTPTADEKVKHFKRSWSRCQMFYGLLSFSRNVNFSRLLNKEIERAQGNGIVNLTVRAKGSGLSWFISLIPILPETVRVVVEGDVIQSPGAEL